MQQYRTQTWTAQGEPESATVTAANLHQAQHQAAQLRWPGCLITEDAEEGPQGPRALVNRSLAFSPYRPNVLLGWVYAYPAEERTMTQRIAALTCTMPARYAAVLTLLVVVALYAVALLICLTNPDAAFNRLGVVFYGISLALSGGLFVQLAKEVA